MLLHLPIDFRTVVLLGDIEGITYDEISNNIEVPIGTVRTRLLSARNMIKEKLLKYAQKIGYEDKRGIHKAIKGKNEEE